MLRVACMALALFVAGCETCGPPAEPLIDFVVNVETATTGTYLHAAMFNSVGEYVDAREADATSRWSNTLGHCDGDQQVSGQFTILAWLSASSTYDEHEPGVGDLQSMDLIDVHCDSDGCFATRDASITLR